MSRPLPLLALPTLLAYLAACLALCPGARPAGAAVHARPHAAQAAADPHDAHGHPGDHAGAAHARDESPAPGPCALDAACPCGCDSLPQAPTSASRVPLGIAAATPVLPSPAGPALGSPPRPSLPRAPAGAIDHVPIPS